MLTLFMSYLFVGRQIDSRNWFPPYISQLKTFLYTTPVHFLLIETLHCVLHSHQTGWTALVSRLLEKLAKNR